LAKKNKRKAGVVLYRLVCTAEHIQTQEKVDSLIGRYTTLEEAEMKKLEQEEAVGSPDYEYSYRIDLEPIY
jgi:hypothetical protein